MEVNPSEPEPAAGLKPLLTALQFDVVRRDPPFVLYRAREKGASGTMLALAPAGRDPSPATLSRLQHEYSLRSELDAAWAIRALDLVRVDGVPMLLLEDPRGESLDRLVGRPMDVTRFLRTGVGLSAALARLHARGIIHKDIRPANVVVDLDAGAVHLFGFGVASRVPRERLGAVPRSPRPVLPTWHRSKPAGSIDRSIPAPTCTRRASCSTRCSRVCCHSTRTIRSNGSTPTLHEAPSAPASAGRKSRRCCPES